MTRAADAANRRGPFRPLDFLPELDTHASNKILIEMSIAPCYKFSMPRIPGKNRSARRRAQRLDPSERRPQLMRCALHVFARRGLGAARHSEIAREAKVSVPTVFFYFPTRDALVKAVLDEVARFLTDMTIEIHASSAPAPDIVLAHAKAFADSVDTHPDHARVWLDWSTAMREEIWPL